MVSSTITDSTGIGADSLYYNINGGQFIGVAHDSSNGDDYYFTIPAVAQTCTLGYFLWAEDSFSVVNSVDIWNTDPICAPESTYYVFEVTTGIEELTQFPPLTQIMECFPNPFSKLTHIRFQTPSTKSQVTMSIYDATGRLIKDFSRLTPDALRPTHIIWDGTDNRGRKLASAVYFVEGFLDTSALLGILGQG
jgi:hypothetical protein